MPPLQSISPGPYIQLKFFLLFSDDVNRVLKPAKVCLLLISHLTAASRCTRVPVPEHRQPLAAQAPMVCAAQASALLE